ncbi:hypothetical protein H5P36_23790 [Bacillus sp. APMAM]|nr:hypothetical protein [Bacillus sp. APMAM]RTZ53386.1 hypothetical protein EKO25_23560 [Bacillus sp. SAJ1]
MDNQNQLLEDIKSIVNELVKTNNMMIQSNQMVIQSNNEIKQLLLEKTGLLENKKLSSSLNNEPLQPFIASEPNDTNINAELFKKVVNVYFNEEIERIKSNNVRKSARRVSVELGISMAEFLKKYLQSTGLIFQRFPDGLVLITHDGKWLGAIKFITDLGFHRGEQWFEYVEEIVEHCKTKYSIKKSRIFFIISSLRNGLEQKHVAKLLNRDIRSNWVFMNNRIWVEEYVEKFIELTTILPTPHKQIYIMASELHPNVVADDLHKMTEEQKMETFKEIENYEWISDLNKFLEELKHLI